jgi:hypothetical protein
MADCVICVDLSKRQTRFNFQRFGGDSRVGGHLIELVAGKGAGAPGYTGRVTPSMGRDYTGRDGAQW